MWLMAALMGIAFRALARLPSGALDPPPR